MKKIYRFSGPWLYMLLLALLLLGGCAKADKTVPTPAPTPTPTPEPPATVMLEGREYALDTTELTLTTGEVGEEELREALSQLDALTRLEYPDCPLDVDAQLRLREEFPQVDFLWSIRWEGETYQWDVEELDFRDVTVATDEILRILPLFPGLQLLDLGDRLLDDQEMQSILALCPEAEVIHTAEFFGKIYPSTVEEIDLQGIPMTDTSAIDAGMVHFPHLKKVHMENCGLDNETMDALNQRYENTQFVWIVTVLGIAVPTDNTWFIVHNLPAGDPNEYTTDNLRYCTELVALDLGHYRRLVNDLSFLQYTPKIRYLIIAQAFSDDITYIGMLPELEYLEMFDTPVSDLSPLLNCPKLLDLNIILCNDLVPETIEVLSQMTQLERLFCPVAPFGAERIAQLREALPDCWILAIDSTDPVGWGWRSHPRYYAMRAAFHMPAIA